MTAYELLSMNAIALKAMADKSLNVSDIKYLNLYQEYFKLVAEGHKKTYIMQYLSDEYKISERMIYNVIEKLSSNVDF